MSIEKTKFLIKTKLDFIQITMLKRGKPLVF